MLICLICTYAHILLLQLLSMLCWWWDGSDLTGGLSNLHSASEDTSFCLNMHCTTRSHWTCLTLLLTEQKLTQLLIGTNATLPFLSWGTSVEFLRNSTGSWPHYESEDKKTQPSSSFGFLVSVPVKNDQSMPNILSSFNIVMDLRPCLCSIILHILNYHASFMACRPHWTYPR